MIDARAFLATICKTPNDDGARLVYCDWLEDQGRSDEALLIRNTVAGAYKEGRYGRNQGVASLLGKTISSVVGKVGDEEVFITLVSGEKYKMYYDQD